VGAGAAVGLGLGVAVAAAVPSGGGDDDVDYDAIYGGTLTTPAPRRGEVCFAEVPGEQAASRPCRPP
jgi:hypothetical protein